MQMVGSKVSPKQINYAEKPGSFVRYQSLDDCTFLDSDMGNLFSAYLELLLAARFAPRWREHGVWDRSSRFAQQPVAYYVVASA